MIDALKDLYKEGNRIFDKKILSNGKEFESPSTRFLILAHLENHVIVTNPTTEIDDFLAENCSGHYYIARMFITSFEQQKQIVAFEKEKDAVLFKLRFGSSE